MGGDILASISRDGTLILWDLKEQTLINSSKLTRKDGVKSLAFHPSGVRPLGSNTKFHGVKIYIIINLLNNNS